MATPPIIDVEEWLAPIPGPNPAGRSLAYDPEYDAIREARRAEDDTNQGEWKRETKVADWEAVIALGEAVLREKSKDLQVAAWVTEALTKLHGFAGLRDGLTLMDGLQERYWESYFPEIDDGDLESRLGPFIFLNDPKLLRHLIRSVPLTRGLGDEAYSYLRFEQSRETDNKIRQNPDKTKALMAEGRITGKMFDDQVAQSPRAFYEGLVGDLKQAIEAFRSFERGTDEHFGRSAPSLLNIGKALEEILRLLEPILAAKRMQEPDPEPPPAAVAPEADGAPAPEADGPKDGPAAGPEQGRAPAAADLGRVLIDFRALAQQLAEAGTRLEENRKKHADLRAELSKLDAEYEEISRLIGRDGECHQLLARILRLQGRG